jgi:hypothetical protein
VNWETGKISVLGTDPPVQCGPSLDPGNKNFGVKLREGFYFSFSSKTVRSLWCPSKNENLVRMGKRRVWFAPMIDPWEISRTCEHGGNYM